MKKKAAKRKIKKLQLSHETLRELASTDIPKVKAGYVVGNIFSGDTAGCTHCT